MARAVFERGFAVPPDGAGPRRRLPGTLTVTTLRGYEREGTQLLRSVESELQLEPAEPDPLIRCLTPLGRRPGDVETRMRLLLTPEMNAEEATREILRVLLGLVRLNEEGTRNDLDSESPGITPSLTEALASESAHCASTAIYYSLQCRAEYLQKKYKKNLPVNFESVAKKKYFTKYEFRRGGGNGGTSPSACESDLKAPFYEFNLDENP